MGEPVFSVGLHGFLRPVTVIRSLHVEHEWLSYTRVYTVSALGHTGTQTHTMR